MTVLVTGGAGYIGSHMVLEMLDAGEQVVVLDNLVTGNRWAVPDAAVFVEGSVGDQELVKRVLAEHGIDSILHFAASIVVPESHENPLKYYLNNTANTTNLIRAAVDGGVRHMIFSSTAAVYGVTDKSPIDEKTPFNPISPYGASKMMSEIALRDASLAHPLTYVALRYFNVAGADPALRSGQATPEATHLIKVASQAALGVRDKLKVFGTDYETRDGTGERDYIHVSDLAAAHRVALDYLRSGGRSEIFNCGYGRGATVREVIKAVEAEIGRALVVEDAPRRAGDPASLVADTTKIRTTLDWAPKHDDLAEIVHHAFAWEKKLQDHLSAAE